jgi:hypothetical protein
MQCLDVLVLNSAFTTNAKIDTPCGIVDLSRIEIVVLAGRQTFS